MKSSRMWSVGAAMCAVAAVFVVSPASAAEAASNAVESRIRAVTVYSDRARITRAASVRVTSSPSTVAFAKLPGWVDDASVRVALKPAGAGRIVDVHVKRDYLARSSDGEYRAAEVEVADLRAQLAAHDDELKVLAAQKKQIEAIGVFSKERAAKGTATPAASVETYGKAVEYVAKALRETARARRDVERQKAALQPKLAAKQRRLTELKGLTQLEETAVYVTLSGARAVDASLELTYMLPGATWQPTHELRAAGADPKTAELTSYAVVTQTTGEDWESAAISFSTQSSQESIRIPRLEALKLGETGTATRVLESRMTSFSRARQAFQGQNRLWNKWQRRQMTRRLEQVYESNFQMMQSVQSKTVQLFESLGRRGTTAHFEGRRRLTVRADGQSVRIPLGTASLAATQTIVAAPEQTLNAARTLDMVNSSGQALLPGRVGLYQDGAFLGMTDLSFVAEGEDFQMFLGVADQVKLARTLDRKHSSLVRRRKTRMKVAWVVTVENLANHTVTLDLSDRVPVSENREIKVDQVKIAPHTKPDSKGLLAWNVTLEPGQKRSYRIQYRLEYPPSLILRTKRRSPRPAANAPSDAPIEEQILDLEAEL